MRKLENTKVSFLFDLGVSNIAFAILTYLLIYDVSNDTEKDTIVYAVKSLLFDLVLTDYKVDAIQILVNSFIMREYGKDSVEVAVADLKEDYNDYCKNI